MDFEGYKDDVPVLFGWVYAEGKRADDQRLILRHDVLDPVLQAAVGRHEVEGFFRHDQEPRTLLHNAVDCVGLRHVVIRAADDLAAAEAVAARHPE